jgi:hypothetical protein
MALLEADSDVESDDGAGSDVDDPEADEPLPADPGEAVVELRRRIAAKGGQETLVRCTMEYADDQTQVYALERMPGVPAEWRIHEQLLAEDATARLKICMEVYERLAGYKMSVKKCFVRWDSVVACRPAKRKGNLSAAEVASLGLQYECAGCGRPEASVATCRGHQTHCPYT